MVTAKDLDVSLFNNMGERMGTDCKCFLYCDLTPLRKNRKEEMIEEFGLFTRSIEVIYRHEAHHIDPALRSSDRSTVEQEYIPIYLLATWLKELKKLMPDVFAFMNNEFIQRRDQRGLISVAESERERFKKWLNQYDSEIDTESDEAMNAWYTKIVKKGIEIDRQKAMQKYAAERSEK